MTTARERAEGRDAHVAGASGGGPSGWWRGRGRREWRGTGWDGGGHRSTCLPVAAVALGWSGIAAGEGLGRPWGRAPAPRRATSLSHCAGVSPELDASAARASGPEWSEGDVDHTGIARQDDGVRGTRQMRVALAIWSGFMTPCRAASLCTAAVAGDGGPLDPTTGTPLIADMSRVSPRRLWRGEHGAWPPGPARSCAARRSA